MAQVKGVVASTASLKYVGVNNKMALGVGWRLYFCWFAKFEAADEAKVFGVVGYES